MYVYTICMYVLTCLLSVYVKVEVSFASKYISTMLIEDTFVELSGNQINSYDTSLTWCLFLLNYI